MNADIINAGIAHRSESDMNSDIINAGTSRRCGISCGMRCDISGRYLHEQQLLSIGHLKKCVAETKKRTVAKSIRIAPVSSKKRIAGSI